MRTPNEISQICPAVLSNTFGPADIIWFVQEDERDHGDYTAERDRLLGNPTVDELVEKIEQRRKTM